MFRIKWTPIYIFIILFSLKNYSKGEDVCYSGDTKCAPPLRYRYLFYDVNPPEGFNLRRDVYMRFAVLAHNMQKSPDARLNKFKVVLPPWSHLIHWNYSQYPEQIPWGHYFDLTSLQLFAPVIELYQFFDEYKKKYSNITIDEVYTLQHFEDMFETGNFEDRMEIEECQRKNSYNFFFYSNITSTRFQCLSYHGPATKLTELFVNTLAQTILIDHAEVAIHDFFGSKLYWQARRSMRFNRDLKKVADKYRRTYLNSSDEVDNTVLPENWQMQQVSDNQTILLLGLAVYEVYDESPRQALGGPYLAVHLRRRDFVRNRPNEAPLLERVAEQIIEALERLELSAVFVATDGPNEEFVRLSKLLVQYNVFKFQPSEGIRKKVKDGGIAIIDQIICSHARYFIGTSESTFSFRIQEEREILGLPSESTFNIFCKDKKSCQKPSTWKIVY